MVHDHIDLPFGRLRLLQGGGSGGNNGVKSVSALLGPDYVRLRVGVDRPPSTAPDVVADYVLSPFAESKERVRTWRSAPRMPWNCGWRRARKRRPTR